MSTILNALAAAASVVGTDSRFRRGERRRTAEQVEHLMPAAKNAGDSFVDS